MTDHDKDPLLLDHDYDGIGELDNKLPGWWLWLFYITIAFSGVYLMYYHVLQLGALSTAKYDHVMAAYAPEGGGDAVAGPVTLDIPEEASSDKEVLASGQDVFMVHCIACHGPQGQGLIGPNFADRYFIHGPTFADHTRTIINGVPAKGMIPWRTTLSPDEIYAVGSYIYSLIGTNPSGAKAPEGTLHEM